MGEHRGSARPECRGGRAAPGNGRRRRSCLDIRQPVRHLHRRPQRVHARLLAGASADAASGDCTIPPRCAGGVLPGHLRGSCPGRDRVLALRSRYASRLRRSRSRSHAEILCTLQAASAQDSATHARVHAAAAPADVLREPVPARGRPDTRRSPGTGRHLRALPWSEDRDGCQAVPAGRDVQLRTERGSVAGAMFWMDCSTNCRGSAARAWAPTPPSWSPGQH